MYVCFSTYNCTCLHIQCDDYLDLVKWNSFVAQIFATIKCNASACSIQLQMQSNASKAPASKSAHSVRYPQMSSLFVTDPLAKTTMTKRPSRQTHCKCQTNIWWKTHQVFGTPKKFHQHCADMHKLLWMVFFACKLMLLFLGSMFCLYLNGFWVLLAAARQQQAAMRSLKLKMYEEGSAFSLDFAL